MRKMRRILLGSHKDLAREIANVADRAHFEFLQGALHSAAFADYDCVVPLVLSDYIALWNSREFFGRKFWAPDPRAVALCRDKLALSHFLLGGRFAGFVGGLRLGGGGPYPYILRKRRDGWGLNSFVIRNPGDEADLAERLHSPDYFCQDYTPGSDEFALHVLMVKSEAVYARTVRYEMGRELYVKGKDVTYMRRTFLPENGQLAEFLPLLREIGYAGTCCIDYKLENGAPKLFEINARFGGSLVGDIDRYLEAYLGSLGMASKPA